MAESLNALAPEIDDERTSDWRDALATVAAATVLRFIIAAYFPLVPDEAYYWEWSRRLAPGYFDHPPAIAWLIAGGTALLGDTPLGVRAFPNLVGALGTLALVRLTRDLAGARSAYFAALIFAVLPLCVGLTLATPDAPLFGALGVSLLALVRAITVTARAKSLGWWALAGASIGVAMASKFSAVVTPIGALAAVPFVPALRAQLRTPGPWLAVVVASLVLSPVLWWNAHHDWIAFRFQLGHGLGTATSGTLIGREAEFVGGQIVLLTPVLFYLLVEAVVRALKARDDSARTLLAILAAAVLVFFTFSATRKPVEANWPAIAWLPAVVVLASARRGARTAAERLGVTIAAVTCIVSIVHVFYPIYPVAAKRDPAARGHGWREAAMELEAQGQRLAELTPNVHLAANRYQDAALFAYHLPGHPEVFALNLTSRHNEYDLWPTFRDRAAPGHALMIILQDRPDSVEPAAIRALRPHFRRVDRLDRLAIRRGDEEVTARRLWLLLDWRGTWPADAHSLTFIDGKPAPNGTRDD